MNQNKRGSYVSKRASILCFVLVLIAPIVAAAQSGDEEFIKPSRPSLANPAEIQKPGVLQLEYGYDANFRAEEFRTQQSTSLALRFAASSHLLLELDLDTVRSETDDTRMRMTGVGDTRLGIQAVALEDAPDHPALAFAYYIKLPSASETRNLGTGRVDHKLIALISKKLGEKTDIDFNAAYLNVGREDSDRRASGGQAALSVARELSERLSFEGELSGQSEEDIQPRGVFALGALAYRVNRRLILDGGLRFGLNPEAPRFGLFAGVTIGIADFYKRR